MRRTKAVWFINLSLRHLYLLCLRCSLSIQILWQLSAGEYKSYQSLMLLILKWRNVGRIFPVAVLCQEIYVVKLHWETVPLVWFCCYILMTFCVTVCNNIFMGWKCVYTWISILTFLMTATAQVLFGQFKHVPPKIVCIPRKLIKCFRRQFLLLRLPVPTLFPSTFPLALLLLTCRIWWAPNNASRWQMGFKSAFKWLKKYNH